MTDEQSDIIIETLADVLIERARQLAKWGEQHHPDVPPGVPAGLVPVSLSIPTADDAKAACATAVERGTLCWSRILIEELCEAVEAASNGDRAALREELVQVAAVAAAWVEDLDGRVS